MNKALKILLSFLLILILILLLTINIRLYNSPQIEKQGTESVNTDLLKELRFLEHSFADQADSKMQSIYPEGYVFMNALYGLAWCNVLEQSPKQTSHYKKGHDQIQQAFDRINSETGRSIFDETLPLSYGAFYIGWNNYLLGKKLSIENYNDRDSIELDQFKKQCEAIATAINKETYPESYYGGVWPADAMICVASLALHDNMSEPIYSEHIASWIKSVKVNLDKNGFIPHSIHVHDKTIAENARGSSLSLMLIFLKEIDSEFADEQFKLYKSKFYDTRMGLSGIREYPKGELGSGDIDSGPVILQMGGAATIVGLQTTAMFNEPEMSAKISSTLEGLALPVKTKSEKFYLFGMLPMVDAFTAWSHSSLKPIKQNKPIFIEFHLYSFILFAVLIVMCWWLWKRNFRAVV